MKNILAWCSHNFSTNCWTTKIISEHPHFFRNLQCDSGKTFSASCCSWSCKMCATTLPTTSSRVIPHQLLQQLRSPFLGTGTNTELAYSWGTFFSRHAVWTRSNSRPRTSTLWYPALTISGRIPDSPCLPILQASHCFY